MDQRFSIMHVKTTREHLKREKTLGMRDFEHLLDYSEASGEENERSEKFEDKIRKDTLNNSGFIHSHTQPNVIDPIKKRENQKEQILI